MTVNEAKEIIEDAYFDTEERVTVWCLIGRHICDGQSIEDALRLGKEDFAQGERVLQPAT